MWLYKNIVIVFVLISDLNYITSDGGLKNLSDDDIYKSDFNRDEFLDSFGLITKYGYNCEKVSVTSEDGYIINTFRIPGKGPSVLLVHGVSDSSDEWLVLGPGRSLAYQLADRGLDVWLFNYRGNRYSKGHIKNITKEQYWNFSYEEMGTRDVPAVIDHILNVTSQQKLSYIGFSQGTTVFFVMCSMRPEYNDKIKVPILLAPVAWLSNLKTPLINLGKNEQLFNLLTNGFGLYELFPYDPNRAFQSIICHRKLPATICSIEYRISYGLENSSYLSPDRITVIDSHVPAGVSAKNLMHFIQGYNSKRFQRFDYGLQKNQEMYSSQYPPLYDVKKVTVPVNLIASESDWLSTYKDVNVLKNKLPNIKRFIMYDKSLELSHLEFVYGTRVNSLINDPVINILLDDLNMR